MIRCLPKSGRERARVLGEYLSVMSQLMVESRNDRAKNAWGRGWGEIRIVVERLERWTCNAEAPSSSPVLTARWTRSW